jgi:hypothetical protein
MRTSRPVVTCLFAALLPFTAVTTAHSAPAQKSSKTAVKPAQSAKAKSAKKAAPVIAKATPAAPATLATQSTPVQAKEIVAVAAPQPEAKAEASPANSYLGNTGQPASSNPYLAYRLQPAQVVAAMPTPAQKSVAVQSVNPYLAYPQQFEPVNPWKNFGQVADSVQSHLPGFSGESMSILPKIKTVYPTGEKPLKVLTFKCPTELVGITTPPIKLLRAGVDLAMDGINRTDLLPFNMQQVCM